MKRYLLLLFLLLLLPAGCDKWAHITIHVIDIDENPIEGIAVNYAFEDYGFEEEITDEDGCVDIYEIINCFDNSEYFNWRIKIEDDRYDYYYYEGEIKVNSDFYITLTEAIKNDE